MFRSAFCGAIGALEQVAVRAARRVRKMLFAIRVAAEASGARGIGCVGVTAMAMRAVVMLRLSVQSGERRERMATRARRHAGNTTRPVRAVTRRAAGRDLSVRRRGLYGVAARALHARGRAGVRLVAIRAQLVTHWRGGEFLHVTRLAGGGDAAGVWFMATGAQLMTHTHITAGISVTCHTRGADSARLVRQPLMATLAGGVTDPGRGQRQLLLMATLTSNVLSQRDLEVMRDVTALAGSSAVHVVIGLGDAMTAVAGAGLGVCLLDRGVRLMAGDARSMAAPLRVIGMDVRVAFDARRARITQHVVRGVTARAAGMLGDASGGEHDHVRVAGATINRLAGLECVRLMTTHALGVSSREQRAGWHDRLSFAVAFDAAGKRGGGGRVLMSVTSRAHAVRGLSKRRVRSVDVVVAARAVRGDRLLILVRPMAVQTGNAGVHRDRRNLALSLRVAADAIARAVRLENAPVERICRAREARERVAVHAVCVHSRTEALLGEPRRVLDGGACRVAARTAKRRHHSDRRCVELMTLVARDVLIHDVHPVTADAAIHAPAQLHVDPFAWRAARTFVRLFPRTSAQNGDDEHTGQRENGEPNGVLQSWACTMHFKTRTCERGVLANAPIPSFVPWRTNIELETPRFITHDASRPFALDCLTSKT